MPEKGVVPAGFRKWQDFAARFRKTHPGATQQEVSKAYHAHNGTQPHPKKKGGKKSSSKKSSPKKAAASHKKKSSPHHHKKSSPRSSPKSKATKGHSRRTSVDWD
jgi:hypothetical protein